MQEWLVLYWKYSMQEWLGLCTHSCCRIWLQNVCKKVGLTCASSSHGSESESPASTFNNLTLLAAVASKELEREKTKLVKVAQKASYRSMSLKKLKLDHSSNKQSSKAEKDDIRHKLYIERNLPSLTVSRGRFTERMETKNSTFVTGVGPSYTSRTKQFLSEC